LVKRIFEQVCRSGVEVCGVQLCLRCLLPCKASYLHIPCTAGTLLTCKHQIQSISFNCAILFSAFASIDLLEKDTQDADRGYSYPFKWRKIYLYVTASLAMCLVTSRQYCLLLMQFNEVIFFASSRNCNSIFNTTFSATITQLSVMLFRSKF